MMEILIEAQRAWPQLSFLARSALVVVVRTTLL